MLAIHGIWADGALLLWAEDATRSVPVPATARVKPAEARSHPGAGDPAALAAALAGLAGAAAALAWWGPEGELALWLPGTAACPQPSPELAAVPADGTWLAAARGGGRAALRAWRIPVLSFPAPAALPLLAGLGEGATPGRLAGAGAGDALLPIGPDGELTDSGPGGEPADEVIFGQSVPFLAACAALAADLAARGWGCRPGRPIRPSRAGLAGWAGSGGHELCGPVAAGGVGRGCAAGQGTGSGHAAGVPGHQRGG